jgi:hypothetical protein
MRFAAAARGPDNRRLSAAGMPMSILRMTDLDLAGKRVLVRQGEAA